MNLPFADIRLREAFDLALDREEVIELIWDSVGNYNGPVPWVHDRFSLSQDELRAAMPNNLDRARQLLAAAGYESGLEQTMKMPRIPGVPSAGKLAALIKEQVARVGIKLVLEEVDRGSFIANVLLPGNFDIAFVPDFSAEGPDRALSLYRSRRTRTYPGPYQDPQLDELIEAQESEFDEQKRIEIILRAQRLILKEHGPQLTLPSGYSYSVHWNYVHNPYQPQMRDGENQGGPPGTDVWTEKASA